MKDYFISLVMILASFRIQANVDLPWSKFQNAHCSIQLKSFIQKNKLDDTSFREVLGDSYNDLAFRTNSNEIDNTFEFHFTNQQLNKIVHLQNGKLEIANIDKETCKIDFQNQSFPWYVQKIFNDKRSNDFTDSDLKELVSNTQNGLIYFWSPKFSYSVEYLPEIYKIAKKLKLNLTIIADPRVSNEEINQAINKVFNLNTNKIVRTIASEDKIKIMKSYDLFMRNGFNHFPVMYYYNNKKVHPHWITGLMTTGGIREMTQSFQKELK